MSNIVCGKNSNMGETTTDPSILSFLIKGIVLGAYAALIPGPTQAYIFSQILKIGWRRSMPLAFVPLATDLPIGLLFCLMVAQMPAWFMIGLRFLGSGLLLFLAYDAYKSGGAAKVKTSESENTNLSTSAGFGKAMILNFTNPNVYLFWGTIGAPIVIAGWTVTPVHGMSFVLGMYFMLSTGLLFLIRVFGLTGQLNPEVQKIISYFIAALLVLFAGSQIIQAVQLLMLRT